MAVSVRVGTFNVENLFARYKFKQNFDPVNNDGFTINDLAFDIYGDDAKKITGDVIKELDADVICLQEVEGMAVLERFNSTRLAKLKYAHRMLIDSHDPRFIDVAVLSRHPITNVITHRSERNATNTTWLFSRDCLEVDVKMNGKALSLFVNHFKSMMDPDAPPGQGRATTHARRLEQVQRVAAIVDDRFKSANYQANFIVLGDFNDYMEGQTALGPLVNHEYLVNVNSVLEKDKQWTHYWDDENEYQQLDYILISRALAQANSGVKPTIVRSGLPWRATEYQGDRHPDVGENQPKASDHCPVGITLDLI